MKTLPDSFVMLLGHVKPLLLDDSVCAVVMEGTQAAWVEREGAPARPVDPIDDDTLRALVKALREQLGPNAGSPMGARIPGQGAIHAVEAPEIPGGWLLVLERPPPRSRPLHELVPPDVHTVLVAMMRAGVGILVVGDHTEARELVLHALAAAHPRAVRVVVSGARTVPVGQALQLQPAELTPAALARFFRGLVQARPDLLVLPELGWGGMAELHAAARVGRVLGSSPGGDAEGALALLQAQAHGGLQLCAAAFRAVVEVSMTDKVTVRALREVRNGPGGVVFHTTWVRHGMHLAGGWREAPAVTDRLELPMAPPWPAPGSAPMHGGDGASMFASQPATGVTALSNIPTDGDGAGPEPPMEVTAPFQAPAELRRSASNVPLLEDAGPLPEWDDPTTRGQPVQVRKAPQPPVEDPRADDLPPPLGTDVEQDIQAFKNTVSVPTVPRQAAVRPPTAVTVNAESPFKEPPPSFKEGPSYRLRKPPSAPPPPTPAPAPAPEKRAPPPLPPPALSRASKSALPQQRVNTRSGPKPVLGDPTLDGPSLEDVEGDTSSGVFARARRKDGEE